MPAIRISSIVVSNVVGERERRMLIAVAPECLATFVRVLGDAKYRKLNGGREVDEARFIQREIGSDVCVVE